MFCQLNRLQKFLIFDQQKMSLVRNSSRKKFTMTPEDFASCLDQKNSMIAVLQNQLEELRFNYEKYERAQGQLIRIKQKYESNLRNYQLTKASHQERLDLATKNTLELKIKLDHLGKEIQIRSQQLKEAKTESQQLVEHNSRRQDDATQCKVRGEQLKTTNDLLRMEQERIQSQTTLAREQLERQRRQNANIHNSIETIKDKSHKTQSYIRNLLREESISNQNLTKIQDQNNYIDSHITELNNLQAMTLNEVNQAQKDGQQQQFIIASKQLELKRLQKQGKEAVKNNTTEKEKNKLLQQQSDQKRNLLTKLQNEVRECSEQINYIMAKNQEVTEVNSQLRNDYTVCEKHLQNILKVNKLIETELTNFKDINSLISKKLQNPNKKDTNYLICKITPKKRIQLSMTATGGFENDVSSF